MPVARYWRVRGCVVQGRGDLEITGIALYASGVRVVPDDFFTSVSPSAGTAQALATLENETPVRFAASAVQAPGFFMQWDLGVAQDITHVAVRSAALESTWLRSLEVYCSADSHSWERVTVLEIGIRWPGAGATSFAGVFGGYRGLSLPFDGLPTGVALTQGEPTLVGDGAFGSALRLTNVAAVLSGTSFNGVLKADFCVAMHVRLRASRWQLLFSTGLEGAGQFTLRFNPAGRVQTFFGNSVNGYGVMEGPTVVGLNTWAWVVALRRSGMVSVFVNGVLQTRAAWSGEVQSGTCYFGAQVTSSGITLYSDLDVDNVLLSETNAIYASDAEVIAPVRQYETFDYLQPVAPQAANRQAERVVFAESPEFKPSHARQPVDIDVEVGGRGSIYGTVELYAQAGNIPLPRRVRLHRSRDGLLFREAWSDAQGKYRFEGISQRYTYDVIAWDHEGLQQSVVANDLQPEAMA